jgi:predicted nuclease of predicted toxin-antitoxin system
MKVKFLLDENLPFELIRLLKKKNYFVEHIKKIGKSGLKNGAVYSYAASKKMWIVTRDSDFQSVEKFNAHNISGVILFRINDTSTISLLTSMQKILKRFKNKFHIKRLIVVFDNGLQIYPK